MGLWVARLWPRARGIDGPLQTFDYIYCTCVHTVQLGWSHAHTEQKWAVA